MQLLDWLVVGAYCVGVTILGLFFSDRASASTEDFFLSGRQLPWWLAGVSLVATSFASDTPLFVTGLVRQHGIAGNWHWWFIIPGSVAGLFFFARLWRRAQVMTAAEFVEFRYGPGAGGVLRGFQAFILGFLFNVYALGAWPILGLTKVLEETTAWPKLYAVVFCGGLALLYSASAGLWGVVATDFVQLIVAMAGAVVLAWFAVGAVGGWQPFVDRVATLPAAQFFPRHTADDFWNSPMVFFIALFAVEWWARGIEGDGLQVQRMSACKNERHSFYAMLFYNVAHFALRPWPWIVVALVSLLLFPQVTDSLGAIDHERAYPRMIVHLVPVGFRGLLVASFFAAYMSTVDSHLNWGASQLVSDVYQRFLVKDRPPRHYVTVARIATVVLMVAGGAIAFVSSSIVDAFYNVLLVFSGVGLVGVARWFWWRVNAWSEITAMIASGGLTLLASPLCRWLSWPDARVIHIVIVVVGSTVVWLSATWATRPTDEKVLCDFYRRVRPKGPGWGPIARACPDVPRPTGLAIEGWGWLTGVVAVTAGTMAIGYAVLGRGWAALAFVLATAAGTIGVRAAIGRMQLDDER